ncbi:hypothetical protein [uncultured phage]|nr:hypothetical protein [uncultured phage]
MLQIISGYKLEGLSIASIGKCQSLEAIDAFVSDFISRSDYPVISNVLDFFTYWQLEETKLCQLLKDWQVSSTSIKIAFWVIENDLPSGLFLFYRLLSKEARIHTTSIEVVDFLLEYWPSNQITVIKESRILKKDLAQRIRKQGLDILR